MNAEAVETRDPNRGLIAYATVCAIGVAVIFLTNWPSYAYEIRGGPPPVWYFTIAAALVIPIVFANPASATRLTDAPLFWWFAAYVVVGLVWLLASQDFIEDGSRLWRLRLMEFVFLCTVMVLCTHAHRRALVLVIVGCVFLASAFNWFDVMRPYRFVPQGIVGSNPGRGAGMFMNANSAAEIVVIGTIVVLPFIAMRLRAFVLVAMVVGVAATLSRGGLILAAMVLLGAIFLRLINRVQSAVILIVVPLLIVATMASYDRLVTAADSPLERTITRLNWFEGEGDDESVEARKWAATNARNLFFDDPIFGHGIGATTRESVGDGPHNMYLTLMAEQGLFGLALYVSLIGVLLWGGRRLSRTGLTREGQDIGKAMMIYAGFYLTGGLFSHNMLEASYGTFAVGFLAAAAMQSLRAPVSARPQDAPPLPARLRWRASIPPGPAADSRLSVRPHADNSHGRT